MNEQIKIRVATSDGYLKLVAWRFKIACIVHFELTILTNLPLLFCTLGHDWLPAKLFNRYSGKGFQQQKTEQSKSYSRVDSGSRTKVIRMSDMLPQGISII